MTHSTEQQRPPTGAELRQLALARRIADSVERVAGPSAAIIVFGWALNSMVLEFISRRVNGGES